MNYIRDRIAINTFHKTDTKRYKKDSIQLPVLVGIAIFLLITLIAFL